MADPLLHFTAKLVGPVDLDIAGISSVLTAGPVSGMVDRVAHQVAAGAKGLIPTGSDFHKAPGSDVIVVSYTAHGGRLLGSRAAASVIVTYANGIGLQARYGVLTKPVAMLGLRVSRAKGGAAS